jgi:hypothetical protein
MPTVNVVRVRREGFSNISAIIFPSSPFLYFFRFDFIAEASLKSDLNSPAEQSSTETKSLPRNPFPEAFALFFFTGELPLDSVRLFVVYCKCTEFSLPFQ